MALAVIAMIGFFTAVALVLTCLELGVRSFQMKRANRKKSPKP